MRRSLIDEKYREKIKLEAEKKRYYLFLLYIPLLVWAVVTLFPFLYMLILAGKSKAEIFSAPPPIFFGEGAIKNFVSNYFSLLKQTHFWRNFGMSVYVAGVSSILSVFFCSLAGYGFAMYNFKFKNFLFSFMIFTMMIPPVVSIVPYFSEMKYFGWLNTPKALYLPVIANAYGVFLMRQFIETSVDKSLLEAARIDGATELSIYFRLVLPLIKPALGTLAIISFLVSWNDFLRSLVIMTDKVNYTVPVALNTLKGMQSVDYGAIMVGTSISVVPIIIVAAFMSKWVISRMTEGAIKG